MLQIAFDLPLWIGYLVTSIVIIPLILNGFSFISKFQRYTQPVWAVLQILSITGVLLLFKSSHLNLTLSSDSDFNLYFLGYSLSILMALISQIGEQVDYLRFMPDKTKDNLKARYLGTLVAGPGWIFLGGIKILIGAFLGVYLLSIETPFENAIDPNFMYLKVFDEVTSF